MEKNFVQRKILSQAHPGLVWVFLNAFQMIAERYTKFGPHSAFICASCHVENFAARLKNSLFKSSRFNCPCCGWSGRHFRAVDLGQSVAHNLECPNCHAHDRHRMLHLVLRKYPPAFTQLSGTILHFAPEPHIINYLRDFPKLHSIATDIETGSLIHASETMFLCDIHHVALADNSINGIFNVHVLEHVKSDVQAISEMHRVLKPGGVAIIMVPFDPNLNKTEEWGKPNPEIFDHVRNYALADFPEKLGAFEVTSYSPDLLCSPEETHRFNIRPSEVVFYCTKR